MEQHELRWLSARRAAEYLDVRPDALQRLVKLGRIPAPSYQLGPRLPLWDRLELDRALGNNRRGNDPQTLMEKYLETVEQKQRRRPYTR